MKVLIAFEFSGVVRDAFIGNGHKACSVDIIDSIAPGPHIREDIRKVNLWDWDLVIAHPPCTLLACSGARHWKGKKKEQFEALEMVYYIRDNCARWAIENPVGIISSEWRKPDQIIQPWQFGHGDTKATCLWLNGLPPLKPTCIVGGRNSRVLSFGPSVNRGRLRSITYAGIARAMAEQWGAQ